MEPKDVFTFLLSLAGLIIAGVGLATWKKQLRGVKEFDAAFDLNFSILKLREAIKYVRKIVIWPSEHNEAYKYSETKYPNLSESDRQKNLNAYVYELRWQKISGAVTDLDSHLLAAEVLWGKDIVKIVKKLEAKVTELNIGLEQYFKPELRTREYVALHELIFDRGEKDDDFRREIEKIIEEIKDYMKQKIYGY